jgi:hypothetical protein
MQVLRASLEEREIADLLAELRLGFPSHFQSLDSAAASAEITERVAVARNHGLTWRSSVGHFVFLCYRVSPDFYRLPFVQSRMRDERLPPDLRFRRFLRRLTPERVNRMVRACARMRRTAASHREQQS